MEPMAIIRVHKTKDYTTMSNYHFRNKEMSLRAKGLLSLMLSFPDDWDFSVKGLASFCADGDEAIRTALRELEEYRYLVRRRTREENGRLGKIEFDVYEKPYTAPLSPHRDLPHMEKPHMVLPHVEKQAQLNTNKELNTKELNNKRFQKPSIEEVRAYIKEIGGSFTAEAFVDHYEANGWKIGGKSPMKDWRAAIRNWKRRDRGQVAERTYEQNELRALVNDPLRDYLEGKNE